MEKVPGLNVGFIRFDNEMGSPRHQHGQWGTGATHAAERKLGIERMGVVAAAQRKPVLIHRTQLAPALCANQLHVEQSEHVAQGGLGGEWR